MLYWYSGTGNSRYAAHRIAEIIGENETVFIPTALGVQTRADRNLGVTAHASSGCDDMLGFCFPVYSWGVPPVVLQLIESLDEGLLREKYIYAVLTCGDEAGKAAEMLRKALNKRGVKPNAIFTLIMPNDYVMLPGFDVDSKEVESDKLQKAEGRIEAIAKVLERRAEADEVFEGPMAALKTAIVYPLFKRWGVQPKRWKVNRSTCISCGKCAMNCPAGNIEMKEGYPHWGERCYSCTACFHICPERSIDYGRFTTGKKQYFCPKK